MPPIRLRPLALALLPLALASCGKSRTEVAAAPPPPAPAVVEQPMPRPPLSAATNLTLPRPGPDGRYPTPSRNLSQHGTAWHLRAALNVAVLQCARAGEPMEQQYNAFLATHKKALSQAHDGLKAEYRRLHGKAWQDRFDDDMTRLYNFYAQPPARAAFCQAAAPLVAAAAITPNTGLDGFAAPALASLDVPFTDFYRAYDAYRTDLAAWQAGQRSAVQLATVQAVGVDRAPRLAVSADILMGDTSVVAGNRIRYAAR
ncbi:hypothetical protein [Sphingomonas sp.]|uniref:hypothetical protein n=1 Tax=Sphingomonas sp. TaxID=28214 RepID=UPI002CDAAAE8|nr:hypothetical protein [Sphingomonas sp.]HTG38042.1 hypothetical protein [Sphingomonas sp.]